MHLRQNAITVILLSAVAFLTGGCFQQYSKTNTKQTADEDALRQLKTADKYFIIHYTDKIMAAQNVRVSDDKLEADLQGLSKEHAKYLAPPQDDRNVMKAKYKGTVLKEVHLYSNTVLTPGDTHIALPLTDIRRMDVYEQDQKATRENRTMSIIGVSVAAVALAITIIVIANPPVSLSGF